MKKRRLSRKFTFLCIPQDGGEVKTFSLSTSWIRRVLIGSSLFLVLFLLVFAYFFSYWVQTDSPEAAQKLIAKAQNDKAQLSEQVETFKVQIKGLQGAKNSNVKVKGGLPKLTGINNARVAIEEMKVAQLKDGKLQVKFRLVNENKTEQLSGYLVLVRKDSQGLVTFPNAIDPGNAQVIDFRRGEFFRTRRFREVSGKLPTLSAGATTHLLLYNSQGDLVYARRLKEQS